MRRRPRAAPAPDLGPEARRLVPLALSELESLLGNERAAIRLAAAREILDHTTGRGRAGTGARGAARPQGRSTTEAALQVEEELRRQSAFDEGEG